MTTARDELAAVLERAYDLNEGMATFELLAHATLAAGYSKPRTITTATVLSEVVQERERQNAKWGEQNHPNGTGPETYALGEMDCLTYMELGEAESVELAAIATLATDKNARCGTVTWKDILLEEIFEALAEEDPAKLRTELVQVAAVATQWVEAIDRGDS